MIYTLTLNPAIDYYMSMGNFQLGSLNSLEEGYTLPGGKGINVSKVLKNFSVESKALGFVGGFTGDYIKKHLNEYEIESDFIELQENTRINIKLKTKDSETEIAGKSPTISRENVKELLKKFEEIKKDDVVILSGSVPNSISKSIYADIIKLLPKDCKVILDTRGLHFVEGLKEGVFLTKPNNHELEEFFNRKLNNIEEIIQAGKDLQALGSKNVLISLGKDGSILITEKEVYIGNAPQGKLISSVGAGDSMVAGVVYGIAKGMTLEDSYKYGIASGSSTAFSEGLTTFEGMNSLLNKIEIKKY
ncbi:1-phosphofructokinase [Fusobacterium mortiferum]|jgi:1-phosphofructokinase|uniref:1-phosphofructokinase n=2 Tax=Fusobacterium mortiferum TaxID=850 RepID=A0A414PSW5_FUSMR|nr:1-phosphofructokinase [Fusobacterium mortiferum]AVQ19239.1 1-phosphofructokinase [Fusobacterium mortiferum ATCC 9817]EEO36358.1 1-phosphofructokinase [Fusobacterium mortiferum ATCC 9817]MCF2628746.1 1-phosphofructokinase [Fusobacterium mortiferum]MCF2699296.1 1-phosphofructokinase [Fusobacterium mortiferum]MCI7188298.1 1-phosphofructokinase [Fusobacterium mortiferum]